jgi:hypothetical protein
LSNRKHGALDPTPFASLAPIATYTIVDPEDGGALGAVGLLSSPSPNLPQAEDKPMTNPRIAIRKIGVRSLMEKNVHREERSNVTTLY